MSRAVVVTIGLGVAALCVTPPVRAHAAQQCAPPGPAWHGTPWPQQTLAPSRVWPFADGSGVLVAVLSTGVDGGQPQLAGSVAPGFDALAGHGAADDDCVGVGTAVAGTIAAHDDAADGNRNGAVTGLAGIAPKARILPVRVSDGSGQPEQGVDPKVLARGIVYALGHGAAVIDIPEPAYRPSAELQAAVADAAAKNVVIVVAAGRVSATARAGGPPATPFPAVTVGARGLLAVGAVGPDGRRWTDSPVGGFIGLVAPGVGVPCLERGSGVTSVDGTSVASGFVAGAAALVRERQPDASAEAAVRQLTATATPAGAPGSAEYGHGLVNPYSAVEDTLVATRDGGLAPAARSAPPPAKPRHDQTFTMVSTALALLAASVLALGSPVVVRGRRGRWRPSSAAATLTWPEPAEPGPPLELLQGVDGRP